LGLEEGYSGKNTPAIIWDLRFSDDRISSQELAEITCRSLSTKLGQRNRGVKPARFYVLKRNNIPAILIEVGFISNAREERKLRSITYREKIAETVCEGILQYNQTCAQKYTVRH